MRYIQASVFLVDGTGRGDDRGWATDEDARAKNQTIYFLLFTVIPFSLSSTVHLLGK